MIPSGWKRAWALALVVTFVVVGVVANASTSTPEPSSKQRQHRQRSAPAPVKSPSPGTLAEAKDCTSSAAPAKPIKRTPTSTDSGEAAAAAPATRYDPPRTSSGPSGIEGFPGGAADKFGDVLRWLFGSLLDGSRRS